MPPPLNSVPVTERMGMPVSSSESSCLALPAVSVDSVVSDSESASSHSPRVESEAFWPYNQSGQCLLSVQGTVFLSIQA